MTLKAKRLLGIALVAVVALALAPFIPPPRPGDSAPRLPDPEPPRSAAVAFCYDGDSFRTVGGIGVRIIGIDAPERGQPCADKARDFAKSHLEGRNVVLIPDVSRFELDRYGRLLAHVAIGDKDFGRMILQRGLARAVRFSEQRMTEELLDFYCAALRRWREEG